MEELTVLFIENVVLADWGFGYIIVAIFQSIGSVLFLRGSVTLLFILFVTEAA